jgi:hypothetical protein
MITSRNPASYYLAGLGQTGTETGIGPGTLNCPGDPQCFIPGGLAYTPTPPVGDLSFWGTTAGNIVGQQLAAAPPPVPTGPLAPLASTALAYPSLIWWGVGIVALIAFMGRR